MSALVIIGLMSGAVLMTLPSAKPAALVYGDAMLRDLNRASQSSLISGKPAGFGLSAAGYEIYTYENEAWSAVVTGAPGGDVTPVLTVEGRKERLPERPAPMIVFDPAGVNAAFSIMLTGEGARVEIIAGGGGEIILESR